LLEATSKLGSIVKSLMVKLILYKRKAARPAAATKPGKAVCIGALLPVADDLMEEAAELALDKTPPLELETLEVITVVETLLAPEDPPTPPIPPAEATEVKTVEIPVVSVEPSVVRVDSMVEIAEEPTLPTAVEKMVELPIVEPSETTGTVVIGTATGIVGAPELVATVVVATTVVDAGAETAAAQYAIPQAIPAWALEGFPTAPQNSLSQSRIPSWNAEFLHKQAASPDVHPRAVAWPSMLFTHV